MDLSNSIISFIDALGVVQGLLFGFILILYYSKKNKSILYLGLFIILFSLEPIPNVLHDLGILKKYPKLELLPIGFHFLAYPFLLIYIQKISILKNERISNWTLIPGVIEFFIAIIIFVLPIQIKLKIKESPAMLIYFISGLCYSLYIAYLILKQIHSHLNEVENQYTYIQSKTLNWCKWFTYVSIVFHLLIFLNLFFKNHVWYAWVSVLNVILIYWVSFKGVSQENIVALVWSEKNKLHPENKKLDKDINVSLKINDKVDQTTQSFMSSEEANEICLTVESHIKDSKCYTNNKLTIIDIAEATNIHPKRISHSINTVKSLNFNNYINYFRVELAKKLLKSEETQNLSIEGIGFEAGFHTKATFYSAFKKNVNMTPAQYKSS